MSYHPVVQFSPAEFYIRTGTSLSISVTLSGPVLSGEDDRVEMTYSSSDARLSFNPDSLFWHGNDIGGWAPTKIFTATAAYDAALDSVDAYNVTSVAIVSNYAAYSTDTPLFAGSIKSAIPPMSPPQPAHPPSMPPSPPPPKHPPSVPPSPHSPSPPRAPPDAPPSPAPPFAPPTHPPLTPPPKSPPYTLPVGWRVFFVVAVPAAVLALCLAGVLASWIAWDRPRASFVELYEEERRARASALALASQTPQEQDGLSMAIEKAEPLQARFRFRL